MDEQWIRDAREMILILAEDLKETYRENLTRKAVISAFDIQEEADEVFERLMTRVHISERVSAKLLPLTDFAIRGLDDEEAQELLERVRIVREEYKKRGSGTQ